MPKKTLFFIFLLFGFMALLGLNYFFEPFREIEEKVEEAIEQVTPSQEIASPAGEAFSKLENREKIGQILAWPLEIDNQDFPSEAQKDQLKLIESKKVGFYTLFGSDLAAESVKAVTTKLKKNSQSGLEPWIAVDHEGGDVQRLSGEGFTRLVSWNRLCTEESEVSQKVLIKSAQELSAVGIDLVFGPVVDVGQTSDSFLGNRVCSDDPNLIVLKAAQYINAFKTRGILSVIKHFPGIGLVKKDLHQQFSVTSVSKKDVFIYRNLLDYFPDAGVLIAHVGLDNQFDNVPCSLSESCVGELANNFSSALIFSDALEMKSASYISSASKSAGVKEPNLAEVAKKAILAGNNVLVFGPNIASEELTEVYDMLILEYSQNPDFKTKIDQSVKKIIDYKLTVKENIEDGLIVK